MSFPFVVRLRPRLAAKLLRPRNGFPRTLTAKNRAGANLDQHCTPKVRIVCTQMLCHGGALCSAFATMATALRPAFFQLRPGTLKCPAKGHDMTTPEWLKPGIYGALLGAALVGIGGFSWGGWMTRGGAEELATSMAEDEVIAALVPVCLEISRTDPNRVVQMAAIREASAFQRRNVVMDAGWATVPGADAPSRELALACIEGLDLDAS